jgi:hypothetical protein
MSIAKHAPEKQMKHTALQAHRPELLSCDQNSITEIPMTLANQSEVGRGVRQYAKQEKHAHYLLEQLQITDTVIAS